MKTVSEDIVLYVAGSILPRYDSFDSAHRRDHIQSVIAASMKLAERYDVNPDMVYVIAAYHDLGIAFGREEHNIHSGRILEEDTLLRKWFTPEQILIMKEAVEDHRASSSHEPRSIYGRIVSEADRNIIPENTMRRIVQYGIAHYPQYDKEEHYKRFVAHLQKKYSDTGYVRLWLEDSPNAAPLERLRTIIRDSSATRQWFEILYEKEIESFNR